MPFAPLSSDQLYNRCPADWLPFDTTEALKGEAEPVGQGRALEAIEFSVGMLYEGYNLYVAGSVGLGKFSLVEERLNAWARQQPAALDLCYIHNFETVHKPKALMLPSGTGRQLQRDMEELLEYLLTAIPEIFRSDEYRAQREELRMELEEREEEALSQLAERAQELNVGLLRTPSGYTLGPMIENQHLNAKEFAALPKEEQERIKKNIEIINNELKATIRKAPKWREELGEKIKALNREFLHLIVDERIHDLQKRYTNLAQVLAFIENVFRDIMENADDFKNVSQREEIPLRKLIHSREFKRFNVNILVEHSGAEGAPVVYEDNPTYPNLLGRIEHESDMGTLVTNFTLIKGGALHRANGGYLILDARKMLMTPFVWETLKRALRAREIRIQPLEQQLGLLSTTTLEPEPIPLNIKVVLIGDRWLYYLLKIYDPEVSQLFKVYSDFSEDITRDRTSVEAFAHQIARLGKQEKLNPLSRDAVARVIEQAARNADDGLKLSLHKGRLEDLLRESDYWCRQNGASHINASHVQKAVDQQEYRQRQLQEKMLEAIERDILLIDVSGEKVAQLNGLSVIRLGEADFGRPSRITATARLGTGKVVDIERETELGGPLHSKGVLILGAYLANRYACKQPLSLSASLVFEQSYGFIDGDSASLAELCVLLSAIAEVPLQQRFAVTGSVNQLGQVQAIGGVNEKVEGFYNVCEKKGLSGEQGVIIPVTNIPHLMLRHDIVAAAEQGQFQIYAVDSVDQAITLLTGMEAGEANRQGQFPADSFNGRVQQRLREFEQIRSRHLKKDADSEESQKPPTTGKQDDAPGRDQY